MKAFLMKLLKDKAMKKAGESLNENGVSLSPLFKYIVPAVGGSVIFYVLGIIVICIVVFGPVMMAREYIDTKFGNVGIFFEKVGNFITLKGWCTDSDGGCDKLAEQKYFEKLDDVYEYYRSRGIDVDTDLITGTVFYGSTLSQDMFSGDDGSDNDEPITASLDVHLSDIKKLATNMVSGSFIDYNKYREYLVSTYIPNRYSHLYTTESGKERIADDIMSFADKNKENLAQSSVSANCSQVSMRDEDGQIKILSLEDYVAGVVSAENDYGVEASKMQAIAARTNAVSHCNSVLENSTNFQKYVTPSSSGISAASATKGLILTYNGKVLEEMAFASYPRAFYKDPLGFKGYYEKGALCGDVVCNEKSDGRKWCQTTIYKLPGLESFTLDMPDKDLNGDYWNGSSLSNQGGHCYGVSQVATRYYEDELNYDYKKMIEAFFSDGVEISDMSTVTMGLIAGGKYSSNAPLYNTSTEFFGNIDYNYWASTSAMPDPWNYGQCPWYARGRALQLVGTSNMPDDIKQQRLNSLRNTNGDGGMWYDKPDSSLFSKSTDLYAARPGSIVSWRNGSYGHVGIVEDVEYDSNGRATRVLLSEGWNKTDSPSTASYQMKWWDIEQFSHYYGGYTFIGYVYLLD